MEHIEIYHDRRFWAWTERDGTAWNGSFAIDNGTLETGLGCEHHVEECVLQTVIELARARVEAQSHGAQVADSSPCATGSAAHHEGTTAHRPAALR